MGKRRQMVYRQLAKLVPHLPLKVRLLQHTGDRIRVLWAVPSRYPRGIHLLTPIPQTLFAQSLLPRICRHVPLRLGGPSEYIDVQPEGHHIALPSAGIPESVAVGMVPNRRSCDSGPDDERGMLYWDFLDPVLLNFTCARYWHQVP